jgi:hypothetical protein
VVELLQPGEEKNYYCKERKLTLKKTLATVGIQNFASIEIRPTKAEEPSLVEVKEVQVNENLKDKKVHQKLVMLLADNLLTAANNFFKEKDDASLAN